MYISSPAGGGGQGVGEEQNTTRGISVVRSWEGPSSVSTEVLFLLPAEYGIFGKTYGIPRNSAVFLQ